MIIKKAVYRKVQVEQKREVKSAVYGCDCCRAEIKDFHNETQRLEVKVWPDKNNSEVEYYHFCSWRCVLKFIPTIKSSYFADLPFLYFDEGKGKRTATELINILTKKR